MSRTLLQVYVERKGCVATKKVKVYGITGERHAKRKLKSISSAVKYNGGSKRIVHEIWFGLMVGMMRKELQRRKEFALKIAAARMPYTLLLKPNVSGGMLAVLNTEKGGDINDRGKCDSCGA